MVNQKKEDILTTATKLFSEFGYQSVGVDMIIQGSGVAKMTFYKHFPSKDILIRSVLIRRNENLQISIQSTVDGKKDAIGRLKSIFDWYESWFLSPDFNGCMFIRASEEFRDDNCPIRKISHQHKEWFVGFVESLLAETSVKNRKKLSELIVIMFEGLTVKAAMYNTDAQRELRFAWESTQHLIDAYSK